MPHTKTADRAPSGSGSIRKICRKSTNGQTLTYYQARYTVGIDPGTGKQIQKSICGKSKAEVAKKLREVTTEIDKGTYREPCRLKVGEWLDLWLTTYVTNLRPRTYESYELNVRLHIKPAIGAVKLNELTAPMVQQFYNTLTKGTAKKAALSPKTVRCIHGILHKAISKAIQIGYLRENPTDVCELPRVERKEIKPLEPAQISAFLKAIKGHPYEAVYMVTLFTGMRRGEVLGLTWDCVDFENGTLRINKQLQKVVNHPYQFELVNTKNGKGRTIAPAETIMNLLRQHRKAQSIARLEAGPVWHDNGLVFCNERGENLSPNTVYHQFKKIVESIGLPEARFHDLRHSYAVAALSSGDDVKTVQSNLGHATASFTLDVYGHVTDQMRKASASRMDQFIKAVGG